MSPGSGNKAAMSVFYLEGQKYFFSGRQFCSQYEMEVGTSLF